MNTEIPEGLYYEKLVEEKIICQLCPHNCVINSGKTGKCKVRRNLGGILQILSYGFPSAINTDPIEKKPLYHFYPTRKILSIGTLGCNMNCFFCQNHGISQFGSDTLNTRDAIYPESIIRTLLNDPDNLGIAFTYNEPVVFYEYMKDIALLSKEAGYKNFMVSNGFMSEKPLKRLFTFIDAFNIDLKGFTNDFYKRHTSASIEPVKKNLISINKSNAHLEITNLLIPGLNDSDKDFLNMISWIRNELGADTPLHISRYYPNYKSDIPPTLAKDLKNKYFMAKDQLDYVFLGNYQEPGFANTYCPGCQEMIIERSNYKIKLVNLSSDGKCTSCGTQILKHF